MSDAPIPLRNWLLATAKERHRPPHSPLRGMAVFITAATLDRTLSLAAADRRDAFRNLMFNCAHEHGVEIVAWVVLTEHYHAVLVAHDDAALSHWLNGVHRLSSTEWNREGERFGRQCWHDYWDKNLWTEGDVISRVNYVHENPERHGYVKHTSEWPWSSYHDFQAAQEREPELIPRFQRFPAPRKIRGDDF